MYNVQFSMSANVSRRECSLY